MAKIVNHRLAEPVTIAIYITTDHPGASGQLAAEARRQFAYLTRKPRYSAEVLVKSNDGIRFRLEQKGER